MQYEIKNSKEILENIIPIIEENPMLTSKTIDYKLVKETCEIIENKTIAQKEKYKQIEELKREWKIEKNTVLENNPLTVESTEVVERMTDDWLIGFWEAEGSFYIAKHEKRYVHKISIKQKLDKRILNTIKERLKIIASIYYYEKQGIFILTTERREVIEKAAEFFKDRLKGRQKREYEIWAESIKDWGDSEKLKEVQKKLRSIRET